VPAGSRDQKKRGERKGKGNWHGCQCKRSQKGIREKTKKVRTRQKTYFSHIRGGENWGFVGGGSGKKGYNPREELPSEERKRRGHADVF